ncbi:MAG TPA: ectonucleotide pyrophosphatase/phosphodiesterase [Blastocatellia bacterium]|nr:ectonucleotide pyrophosphatase/phosphodiesterase [Blastocatellia bacterium]
MTKKLKPAIQRLLALCLFLLAANPAAFAQAKPITDLKPTVILISIDGFRSDYLEKFAPPNLRRLAKEGVRARWMTPSFPSKTFPNHYAIATGLYPQNNGIVENNIYDPATRVTFTMDNRQEVRNSRWWLGEPIWITAERQGQHSAPLFFPGSEAEINGYRPTFWKPYDGKMPNEARVDLVLSWFDLPARERPTLMTLYFSDVDSAGHEFSPEARETKQAVFKVDRAIGHLIAGLKARGIFERVNLLIVSDHGMATQLPNQMIVVDKLFDASLAEKIIWTGEIVGIFPKAGKEEVIYDALKAGLPPQARVYHKREVPARFHYSDSPRIPPLLVLPDEGWVLTSQQRLASMKEKGEPSHARGGHGYDNQLPSMRALFIAHGEAIKRDKVIPAFENVQVYNIMCAILGLKPAPNDGNMDAARAVLNDRHSPGR